MNTRTLAVLALGASALLTSCDSSTSSPAHSPTPSETPRLVLGTATSVLSTKKLEAELWSEDSLRTGWNVIHVRLRDPRFPDSVLTDVHLKSLPWMSMATRNHGAPGENLGADTVDGVAIRGGFKLAAVFQMPSGAMGSWKMRIRVHDHRFVGAADSALQNDTVTLGVNVSASAPSRVSTFLGTDSVKRVVALIGPRVPVVGTNAVEFGMWSMKDSVNFPGDSAVSLSFEPTMPSMGHGSEGNSQPVARRKGHYFGAANYTMTGDWRLSLRVADGATLLDSTRFFDVTVR